MEGPIACYVSGEKGYVWDATGAMRLRKRHRIMGCLVGSVAQFKNQNEVNYLPLELSADEVTLAAQRGWIELFPETSTPVRTAAVRAARATAAANHARHGGGGVGGGASWGRSGYQAELDEAWEGAYQAYYSQFDPQRGFVGRFLPLLGAKRLCLAEPGAASAATPKQQQQRTLPPSEGRAAGSGAPPGGLQDGSFVGGAGVRPAATEGPEGDPQGHREGGSKDGPVSKSPPATGTAGTAVAVTPQDGSGPGWREAVTEGSNFTIPLTAAGAAGQAGGGGGAGPTGRAASGAGPVDWSYPSTPEQRLRFEVFCDLHRQGYMMTGGIKFGSDMLAYPGDPSLYHAQFTVRPVPSGAALNPMVLKAAARGSHAARKHMLLAFYENEGQDRAAGQTPRIKYFSFGPESGFGSKA